MYTSIWNLTLLFTIFNIQILVLEISRTLHFRIIVINIFKLVLYYTKFMVVLL